MINYENHNGTSVAIVSDININNVQDALDVIAQASYDGCSNVIIQKNMLPDSFFSLKTGLAGEILQKFSNYRAKLAIVGDFDNITSNSLKSFIYECNKGNSIFFVKSVEDAIASIIKNQ